ncbi:hypothetical protein AB0878_46265 [Amycolatopsis sp. NPDC047767]|uniref:hypothetical protein n=1 Tax=Amycolatopsis sp. NPDC047767 TaxID=3156765 RepID=UPI003453F59B
MDSETRPTSPAVTTIDCRDSFGRPKIVTIRPTGSRKVALTSPPGEAAFFDSAQCRKVAEALRAHAAHLDSAAATNVP